MSTTAPSDLNSRIRDILAKQGRLAVGIDEVADEDNLFRLGLSSHANVAVMLALEDELDVEFPDEMLRKETFESVSAIARAVSQLIGTSAPTA
ncbi:MAG TPA: acyl carrier protein [Acidimicrobiales bacterium]|nr:acyl carrier protein [Acidimicrobiales bacterium]